ncbi:MAG TPA: (2Fe-2S) ferredoxin domain-containing protein [Candidatus Polarisedimenticolia bacterium]|nr:(2Fe-2S) ferredoxin domain-containing protein [Candidatus Polarisedimenticolia bacterium]
MPPYQRHIFVCTNRREPGDPKGCCAEKGSEDVRSLLKQEISKRGLKRSVRANSAGCLDACAHGATVVIYPEAVWYGGVTAADVHEILERHVVRGEVVERLLIPAFARPRGPLPPLDGDPR